MLALAVMLLMATLSTACGNGDNYLKLAFTLGIEPDALRSANGLWHIQSVPTGVRLRIPLAADCSCLLHAALGLTPSNAPEQAVLAVATPALARRSVAARVTLRTPLAPPGVTLTPHAVMISVSVFPRDDGEGSAAMWRGTPTAIVASAIVAVACVMTGQILNPGAMRVWFLGTAPYQRNANPGGVERSSIAVAQGTGTFLGEDCQLQVSADGPRPADFRIRFRVGTSNANACL